MSVSRTAPVFTNDTPADDRTSAEPDDPGTPTLQALIALWAERDSLYAQRPKALTHSAIESIRQFRLKEVNELPAPMRAKAAMRVLAWYPPQHGQGTGDDTREGLRSWL